MKGLSNPLNSSNIKPKSFFFCWPVRFVGGLRIFKGGCVELSAKAIPK